MKLFAIVYLVTIISVVSALPQHQQVDPSYLQQYYSQIAQQGRSQEATPIYEQGQHENEAPQYAQQGQQIRVKDTVSEQARQQAPQAAAYVAPSVRQYQQHQPQQQAQQAQQVQYVQQPIQYKQAVPKQTLVVRRPQTQPQYQTAAPQRFHKDEEEEEEYSEPQSYQFGFDVKDDEFTNYQNRKEVKEGNVIKGSYSVVDSDGFIRTVTYTADPKEGFKAEVVREPTDIVVKFPTPAPEHRLQPSSHHRQQAPNHSYEQQQQPQQHQHQAQPQYRAPQKQQYQYQ